MLVKSFVADIKPQLTGGELPLFDSDQPACPDMSFDFDAADMLMRENERTNVNSARVEGFREFFQVGAPVSGCSGLRVIHRVKSKGKNPFGCSCSQGHDSPLAKSRALVGRQSLEQHLLRRS